MGVVVVIPARFGATRLEGKVIADICGKPMVQHVYERAGRAGLVDDVMVATDDRRVVDVVEGFGGKVVLTSPHLRSGTDRVAEAVEGLDVEIVVNLQADEPLVEPDMIDSAIKPLVDDPAIPLCTLKTRIRDEREFRDPNVVKVVTDRAGFALYFSRSPLPYFPEGGFGGSEGGSAYKHIGLYVYRKDFLMDLSGLESTPLEGIEGLEQLRALEYGYRIRVVETHHNPVSVDTPEDLERVRLLMRNRITDPH